MQTKIELMIFFSFLLLLLLPQLASAWLPGGDAWSYRQQITLNGSAGEPSG